MTKSEMLIAVKNNLKLQDDTRDLDISDVIFRNQLSGKKSKGSLIMKRSKERDTSRIYPLSKKAKEVSPMLQVAAMPGTVFMACLMQTKAVCASLISKLGC